MEIRPGMLLEALLGEDILNVRAFEVNPTIVRLGEKK